MTVTKYRGLALVLMVLVLLVTSCSPTPIDLPSAPTLAFAPDDDPTVGAVVRSTRQAQATVTRQAQLHEEATQAAVQATQTAEVRATAAVNATATARARATAQAIVSEKAAWPPIIREDFADNELRWPLGVKRDQSLAVTSTLAAEGYQWVAKVDNGNSYFNLVPTNTPVITDFVAAVNVTFGPGSAEDLVFYGLTFRQVKDDYGFFGITKSGMWQALEVHHTGIYQRYLSNSGWINARPGKANRLEVIARGADFVFFINGRQVGMLSAEIDPGRIGLGVDAMQSTETAEVEFADFEVHAP